MFLKYMSINIFEEKFTQKNLSFTNQRRAIAKVVIESDDHPNIDEIFFRVRQIDKTASIATVYRTVNLFTELGLVSKIDFKDKKSRYEFNLQKDHHHIILEDGAIIEFTSKDLEEQIKKIASSYNLDVKDYNIEIYCSRK